MTEIKKLICDWCGNEKNLLNHNFGGRDEWQRLLVYEPQERCLPGKKEKHVCSIDCAIELMNKIKEQQ